MIDTEKRSFGFRDKIGYMFGDFGNDFTFIFASTYLMVFYTKVLGIDAAMVGVLFLVSRCVDAFTDIGMGRIADSAKENSKGRFRVWIIRMCIPVALSSFLMYQSALADASMLVKVIYMFVTYLLWGSIFYTSINIPYGSMASVISEKSKDRPVLVRLPFLRFYICIRSHQRRCTTFYLPDRYKRQSGRGRKPFYHCSRNFFHISSRLLSALLCTCNRACQRAAEHGKTEKRFRCKNIGACHFKQGIVGNDIDLHFDTLCSDHGTVDQHISVCRLF